MSYELIRGSEEVKRYRSSRREEEDDGEHFSLVFFVRVLRDPTIALRCGAKVLLVVVVLLKTVVIC